MPLTEEEKQQLGQLLGSAPATSPATPATDPYGIPPGIPAGHPYVSSVPIGRMRVTVPPPPEEVQRQLAVEQAKQSQKPPKPLTAKQQDAIEGLLGTSATLTELVGFLQQYPAIETGLVHPSFRRDVLGDVTRSFANPEVTQMTQIANRMQDSYRRFVTGVQAGFPEVSRFLPSSIPNPATQPRDKFLAAIDTFSREVERSKVPLRRAMKLRGYSQDQIQEMFAPLPALSEMPTAITSRRLPPGVALSPGLHVDGKGQKFLVHPDGTYELQ